MADISILTNNTYRVLSYMFDNKDRNNLIRITQNEIAEELGLNKSTVNMMVKSLREKGFITQDDLHVGRYGLTDIGVKTVVVLRKIEKE